MKKPFYAMVEFWVVAGCLVVALSGTLVFAIVQSPVLQRAWEAWVSASKGSGQEDTLEIPSRYSVVSKGRLKPEDGMGHYLHLYRMNGKSEIHMIVAQVFPEQSSRFDSDKVTTVAQSMLSHYIGLPAKRVTIEKQSQRQLGRNVQTFYWLKLSFNGGFQEPLVMIQVISPKQGTLYLLSGLPDVGDRETKTGFWMAYRKQYALLEEELAVFLHDIFPQDFR